MILRIAIIAVFLGGFANVSLAGITLESEAKFTHVTGLGTEIPGGVESTTSDVNQTFNPNEFATYTFETVTTTSNPFELKAKAVLGVDVTALGENNPGWQSVTASARAVSSFVDTAIVDGVPGEVGGFVEFVWLVDGTSTINLQPKLAGDAYQIEKLATVAILNPSEGEGLAVDVIENDQSGGGFGPGSNTVDSNQPGVFEQQVFAVDWFAGEEFDVFFELTAFSNLEVFHVDAAGFEATVSADYGNTAVLEQIRIYDNDGNILPNATMTSTDPSSFEPGSAPNYGSIIAVPEPGAATFLLLLTTLFSGVGFCRRNFQHMAYENE